MSKPVYGIGHALVDIEYAIDDSFLEHAGITKGQMTLVDGAEQERLINLCNAPQINRACGGSAANTVSAARQFGAGAFYSCKVADDENGRFYRDDMAAAGIETSIRTLPANDVETGTGRCLVFISPDAERTMMTHLGISESISESELDLDIISNAGWYYMEGYLASTPSGRKAAARGREMAEQNHVPTALTLSDLSMVEFFPDGLDELAGDGVDLLFCNEDEARGWCDTHTIEDAAEKMKSRARAFAITRGGEGSLVFDGTEMHEIPARKVTVRNTLGAGDTYAGAYLFALGNGKSHTEAATLASLAAGQLVTQDGPRLEASQFAEILRNWS